MVYEQTFGDLLINAVAKHPNKIAIVDGECSVTYQELLQMVTTLQHKINNHVKENTVTIIHFPNSLEYIVSYFAVSMLGGILFPVYWNLTEEELNHIIDYTKPSLILTNSTGEEKFRFNSNKYVLNMSTIKKEMSCSRNFTNIRHNNEALLLLTSGTTSSPKIVVHRFLNIIFNLKMHIESLSLNDKDSVLITLPLPFGYCNTSQFLAHIYLGSTLVIYKDIIHPAKILKSIDENQISVLTVVPTLLKSFEFIKESTLNKRSLSSLKYLCFGGSPVSEKTIASIKKVFPNVTFVQTYGQTEAGPRITTKIVEGEFISTDVGPPLPGIKIQIRDSKGKELDKGMKGEVYVLSPSNMMGYYKDPASTREALSEEGYLKTGDVGYLDYNHNLHILGRKKNIIKFKGIQFQPEEIEEYIKNNFPVSEVMVVGEKHNVYGEIPVAYVVTTNSSNIHLMENEIIDKCKIRFSPEKVPRRIYFKKSLKQSLTGKVKRDQM